MNTVQVVITAPTADMVALSDWIERGRLLVDTRLTIDWLIGDWLTEGRAHFEPQQIELVLGEMASDAQQAKSLRLAAKVALAFPPSHRNTALTFEHHAHLADLPVQEALPLLQRASRESLTAKELRLEVMRYKVDTGRLLPREDDPHDDELLCCIRAWNRAHEAVRAEFAEMVSESHMKLIEP